MPIVDVAALVSTRINDLEIRAEREGASMPRWVLTPAADRMVVVRVLPCASDRVGCVDSVASSNPCERVDRNVTPQYPGVAFSLGKVPEVNAIATCSGRSLTTVATDARAYSASDLFGCDALPDDLRRLRSRFIRTGPIICLSNDVVVLRAWISAARHKRIHARSVVSACVGIVVHRICVCAARVHHLIDRCAAVAAQMVEVITMSHNVTATIAMAVVLSIVIDA